MSVGVVTFGDVRNMVESASARGRTQLGSSKRPGAGGYPNRSFTVGGRPDLRKDDAIDEQFDFAAGWFW